MIRAQSFGIIGDPLARRWGALGFLLGASLPLATTLLELHLRQMPFSLVSLFYTNAHTPLLYLVDTAPFLVGMLSAMLGYREHRLRVITQDLEAL